MTFISLTFLFENVQVYIDKTKISKRKPRFSKTRKRQDLVLYPSTKYSTGYIQTLNKYLLNDKMNKWMDGWLEVSTTVSREAIKKMHKLSDEKKLVFKEQKEE